MQPRCFLHVPKSAGSSIHTALEAALPAGSLSPRRVDASIFCDFDDFDKLSPPVRATVVANDDDLQSLAAYAAVSGHFCLETLLRVAPASSVATVLREPRSRLLSLFAYWRLEPGPGPWSPYAASEQALRPIDEFLQEPRLAPSIDNIACRMLLNGHSDISSRELIASADVAEIAALAVARLDTLGYVGILETGDAVWSDLSRFFGATLLPTQTNVTHARADADGPSSTATVTGETLSLIEQRTAADSIVYRHGLARIGIGQAESQDLIDTAFASQLTRLDDLLGGAGSAAGG
jgi:hypothetical protein